MKTLNWARNLLLLLALAVTGCGTPVEYDILISNGTIYDGSGNTPYEGSVGINDNKIAAVGNLGDAVGKTEIDATDLSCTGIYQYAELGYRVIDY